MAKVQKSVRCAIRNSRNKGKNHWILTRRVALTKCLALQISDLTQRIEVHYRHKKAIKDYPSEIIIELKKRMMDKRNFPKEFMDIKNLLLKLFKINSKIYPYGLRVIYFDRKRNVYIASAIYKLVISTKNDILEFYERINFPEFDNRNRKRLINVVDSYKL